MNLRKDHCTHKLQSQPPTRVRWLVALLGGAAGAGLERECELPQHSEALRVLRSSLWRGLGRPPPLQGCIPAPSACRPRPELCLAVLGLGRIHLAVTGLDPGLVPAGGGVLPREAREGSSARVLVGCARQCSSGGSPMKYILSPPRLRTLILTREFELTSEWAPTRVESKS